MRESVHHFFYYLTREITLVIPRLFSRHYHEGMEHVPKTGAALLLSNHVSHFDPSYMGVRFPRYIHFMADKPLLEIPIFGQWLEWGYVFPIDRTKTDVHAIKTALKRLKDGNVVAIFPEEGIRQGPRSVLGGAEMPTNTISLWKKTGVPVIPMVILGSDQMYAWRRWWRRPRVFVRVGKEIPCDSNATREELRDRVVAAWHELYEGLVRNHHIRPDELPKTAQERWGGNTPMPAAFVPTDQKVPPPAGGEGT
jgi:1-acyl-sn-glycerol-3-phosphate acyltransferase